MRIISGKIHAKYVSPVIIGIILLTFVMIMPSYHLGVKTASTTAIDRPTISAIKMSIKIRAGPTTIAVNDKTNMVYVGNELGVSVINGTNDEVVNTIPVYHPYFIAVNPNTNRIYVAHPSYYDKHSIQHEVSVVNGRTNKVIKDIMRQDVPLEFIAVNPNTNLLYADWRGNSGVSVINDSTDEIVASIPDEDFPSAIAVNANTNKIYVANNDNIEVIDGQTNKVVANSTKVDSPFAIAVNPNTNKIYGITIEANRIFVIDGNSNAFMTSFVAGNSSIYHSGSAGIAIDANENRVYMINPESDSVSVVDGSNGLIYKIHVEKSPTAIAVNPTTNMVYVANYQSNTVSIIDGSINAGQFNQSELNIPGIRVGAVPVDVAVNPTTNIVYVADAGSNAVSVIDGSNNKVISNIPTEKIPSKIIVDPDKNRIYVVNATSNPKASENSIISVIDGSIQKVLSNISLGESVRSIGVAHDSDRIYVINSSYPYNIGKIDWINGGKTFNKIVLAKPILGGFEDIAVFSVSSSSFLSSSDNGNDTLYAISPGELSKIDIKNNKTGTYDSIASTIALRASSSAMSVDPNTDTAYVANTDNDTVSVIDLHFNKVVANVTVGTGPSGIDINHSTNMVYVANTQNDSVSVIDGLHNKLVTNIKVGKSPTAVAVNPITNTVYVANGDSNTVSVIDGSINKVVSDVTFSIKPSNSGHIKCNDKEFPTDQYLRIEFNIQCKAEPNNGFAFSSWKENLDHNSSITISTSAGSKSWFYSLLDTMGLKPNDNYSNFNVVQYGNFTAHFEKVSPPIPPEYWIPLYGIIVSSIVGWSIPNIIGWMKAKRKGGRVDQYHEKINSLYKDNELNIERVDRLKTNITYDYAKGRITDQHYSNLKNEISILYEEIYKKKIDSLNSKFGSIKSDGILLDTIKNDITDAYAKGRITDQHYNLLNEKISDYKNNQNSTNELSSSQKIATSKEEGSPKG